jgi:hypothetical protein
MESAKDRSRSKLTSASMDITNNCIHDVTPKSHEITCNPDKFLNHNKIFYDDEIPTVDDECLEIQETIEADCEDICNKMQSYPIDRLISPIPHSDYDDVKSPLNTISDTGYESQDPHSPMSFSSITDNNNDIDFLLNDLFPSLA